MELHITSECSVMTGRMKKSTQPHCANPRCKKLLIAPIRCDVSCPGLIHGIIPLIVALEMQPAVLPSAPVPIRSHLQGRNNANSVETGDHHHFQREHRDTKLYEWGVSQKKRCYGCNQTFNGLYQVCGETKPLVFVDPTTASVNPGIVVFDFILFKDYAQSPVQDRSVSPLPSLILSFSRNRSWKR